MADGRIFIELDPACDRLEESGYAKLWFGRQIPELLTTSKVEDESRKAALWSPRGSDWLLPRPRQFSPDWPGDSRLSDHLIRMSGMTLATGVTGEKEYSFNRSAAYLRTRLFVPSGLTSLESYDLGALATAAGVTLPATLKVIATMADAPGGESLGGASGSDLHPWFSWIQYPAPFDTLCFGWGQLAVLISGNRWYLLKTPENDKATWQKIDGGPLDSKDVFQPEYFFGSGAEGVNTTEVQEKAILRSFMACPVGLRDLWLSFERAGEKLIQDFRPEGEEFFFGTGPWWIAVPENHAVDIMVQVVGYDSGGTDLVNPPSTTSALIWFDLGVNYLPTQDPELAWATALHVGAGETLTESHTGNAYSETVTGGTPASLEKIQLEVKDEAYHDWVSDGTHYKGSLRLVLTPDTAQRPGYLAPAIRFVALRFPPKLTARARTGLTLDDTQWNAISCTTSLRDPCGKRLNFAVRDLHAQLLQTGNYHLREGYPVHVWRELTDGDPDSWVLIARGWVHNVRFRELFLENTDSGMAADADRYPLRVYQFECRGFSSRADEPFKHPPNIVDTASPSGPEHTYAVKESLRLAAFDVTDTDLFYFYPDPWTGTAVARLPVGTPAPGQANDGGHQPDWNETKIGYCQRIAENWRGWLIYETDTKINYHPDLAWVSRVGELFYIEAVLYRTRAEAVAASADPWFVMLNEPEWETLPMLCNTVRISGKDPQQAETVNPDTSHHLIDRYDDSITDVDNPDFLAEERVLAIVSKMAISLDAMKQLGRLVLKRKARRITRPTVEVPFLPYQVAPDAILAVGTVWEMKSRGKLLVDHLEWTIVVPVDGGGYFGTSRISGELLAAFALSGDDRGDYPGQGATPP